jgi:hypothetical protein
MLNFLKCGGGCSDDDDDDADDDYNKTEYEGDE